MPKAASAEVLSKSLTIQGVLRRLAEPLENTTVYANGVDFRGAEVLNQLITDSRIPEQLGHDLNLFFHFLLEGNGCLQGIDAHFYVHGFRRSESSQQHR